MIWLSMLRDCFGSVQRKHDQGYCMYGCMYAISESCFYDRYVLIVVNMVHASTCSDIRVLVEDRECVCVRDRVREFVPDCKPLVCFIW